MFADLDEDYEGHIELGLLTHTEEPMTSRIDTSPRLDSRVSIIELPEVEIFAVILFI